MERVKITLGGREIPLKFTMNQFADIEEQVGNMLLLKELITENKERIRNLIKMLRILGNAGLQEAGETPDLTDEWVGDKMNPFRLKNYQDTLLACIDAAQKSEAILERNETEERDLVLEDIIRKKKQESSPIDG